MVYVIKATDIHLSFIKMYCSWTKRHSKLGKWNSLIWLLFQAANPGAQIEDFVRWHSPRDWIEEEVVTSDGCKIEGEFMEMGNAIRSPVEDCHQ